MLIMNDGDKQIQSLLQVVSGWFAFILTEVKIILQCCCKFIRHLGKNAFF